MGKRDRRRIEREPFDLKRELDKLGPWWAHADRKAWLAKVHALYAREKVERRARNKAIARSIPGAYGDVAPFQEPHSLTIVEMRGARDGEAVPRRRWIDSQFWSRLDADQQEAAQQIARAVESISGSLRYAMQRYERRGDKGHESPADVHAKVQLQYFAWARDCAKRGISPAIVVALLVEETPAGVIDRRNRWRKGRTLRHLDAGLDLWRILYGDLRESRACWTAIAGTDRREGDDLAAFLRGAPLDKPGELKH